MHFITENELHNWVLGNSVLAQGIIVELVAKLVAVSSPNPKERRFPLSDSIGQHGPDGHLEALNPHEPFVPVGRSFWEIGTGEDARKKATSDYNDLTAVIPVEVRKESTFIFVTPLSGRKDWKHTWKEDGQITWLQEKRAKGEWKDVRIIDGTKLVDWIHQFIVVEYWLAGITRSLKQSEVETLDQKWQIIKSIGEPPPLSPNLFLANRSDSASKLNELLTAGNRFNLKLKTHFPTEASIFVAAYVASLDEENKRDISSKCVIVSGTESWNNLCLKDKNLILVADVNLDLNSDVGIQLIQKAKQANHSVIYGGPKGGLPDPNSVLLASPRAHHIEEELKNSGYSDERARILSQQCDGNLSTLLRCIDTMSGTPEWAINSSSSDLAIAAMFGSWNDSKDADKSAIEVVAGKPFGEWIQAIHKAAITPSTPLMFRDGKWKVISRYEAWYALGPNLSDEHIDRFTKVVINLLKQKDPKFDLEKDKRYAAQMYGKVLPYSTYIRGGIADTVALLGSHAKALTHCSNGKTESSARKIVLELLTDGDWQQWASLNDILPLLAEAAPNEFLKSVERELIKDNCVFDELFKQEGNGITGGNYTTGLLWGLETLAWDSNYLMQVTLCLGQLAARDPGGQWANRPANSLRHIFLSWYPQTVTPVDRRVDAVRALLQDCPSVGWELVLSLLPDTHSTSSGTRKPSWLSTIPDDWKYGVSNSVYWQQIKSYAQLAINAAKGSNKRIVELIGEINGLPKAFHEALLEYLASDEVVALPETERAEIWNALTGVVGKHRKFADANWALPADAVNKLADVADLLTPNSPSLVYKRLFSSRDFDLYETKGNYKEQSLAVEQKRQAAVNEIYSITGVEGLRTFYKSVEMPSNVGRSVGISISTDVDGNFLPTDLLNEDRPTVQFLNAFVVGRHFTYGWDWVDKTIASSWKPEEIGRFLAFLPFKSETWIRVKQLLGENEHFYWSKTNANPYEEENTLEMGIENLILHGRPNAALDCLYGIKMNGKELRPELAVRALLGSLRSKEPLNSMDVYQTVQVIKALQENPETNPKDLFQIEWAYVGVLNEHNEAAPTLIEQELADRPEFFAEVISLVFKSKLNSEKDKVETDENKKDFATNAYRLLDNWSKPPGLNSQGNFDGTHFTKWIEKVKSLTKESGHYEVAMTMIGHVLIHAPADPSGLWIHESVASALNALDTQDMRDGFRTASFNSRGVYYFTSGKDEENLAKEYQSQAEAVEAKGFVRFGTTLKELAQTYKNEAERAANKDPYFDE